MLLGGLLKPTEYPENQLFLFSFSKWHFKQTCLPIMNFSFQFSESFLTAQTWVITSLKGGFKPSFQLHFSRRVQTAEFSNFGLTLIRNVYRRDFYFLGYHFSLERLPVVEKTPEKFFTCSPAL
jgi:hypothetical protein